MRRTRKPGPVSRDAKSNASPTVLLLFDESDSRAQSIVGAVGQLDCEVLIARLAEDAGRMAHDVAPDIVVGMASFDRDKGALGCALARSRAPSATLRIFIDPSRPHERELVDKLELAGRSLPVEALGAWCSDVLPGLVAAHAELRSVLSREQRQSSAGPISRPHVEIRLPTLLEDLEDALIQINLAAAKTDTEAARWLGLDPGTMRSKMRKRGIRSPRSRVPVPSRRRGA